MFWVRIAATAGHSSNKVINRPCATGPVLAATYADSLLARAPITGNAVIFGRSHAANTVCAHASIATLGGFTGNAGARIFGMGWHVAVESMGCRELGCGTWQRICVAMVDLVGTILNCTYTFHI